MENSEKSGVDIELETKNLGESDNVKVETETSETGDKIKFGEAKSSEQKCMDIAAKIAPLISGLTEEEFNFIFEAFKPAIRIAKEPIKIDFVPLITKTRERFYR